MNKTTIWAATMILGALTAPLAASAAPRDQADRSDARDRQQRAIDAAVRASPSGVRAALPAAAPAEATFPQDTVSFSFSAPVTYNSNPEQVTKGASDDVHADPTLGLKIARKFQSGAELDVSISGDMDLNFERPGNDSAKVTGTVTYNFAGTVFGWSPYAKYGLADLYNGRFDSHAVTLHNFALGGNFSSEVEGRPKLEANIELARREASHKDSEQNRVFGEVVLSGKLSKGVGWSLTQDVLYKDYTGGTNRHRNDVTLDTIAAVSAPIGGGFDLAFSAQFERNLSDMGGKTYSAWDIGPTLKRSF